LGDQFLIRIVAIGQHSARHDSAKQRLHCDQHRDGERRLDQLLHDSPTRRRNL
jgi:hypothetical protein